MRRIIKQINLTQAELKSQLNYDPLTGIFTRLVSNHHRVKIGDIAGSLSKINGYHAIRVFSQMYKAHRLAWLYVYGKFPENDIDHINRIRHDNRICNLREATRSQNCMNKCVRSDSSSGIKGVHFEKSSNKYKVSVTTINSKQKNIGRFLNLEDAKLAYNTYNKIHHGEFYGE